MLGYCLTDLGNYEQAESELLAALEIFRSLDHDAGRRRAESNRERLVRLYEAWGRPEHADKYRE
jgi:tetratricopeptide (TPR) repeat protein